MFGLRWVVASAALIAASPATAQHLYASGYSSVGNSFLTANDTEDPVGVGQSHTVAYSLPDDRFATDSSSFQAYSDFGINRVYGGASSQAFFVTGGATSEWSDSLTLRSSVDRGILRAALDLRGSSILVPSRYGTAQASISYGLQANQASYGLNYDSDAGQQTVYSSGAESEFDRSLAGLDRYAIFLIPFRSGQSFTVKSEAICRADARGAGPDYGSSLAICNAGNSFYSGGILDVLDDSGAPVSDWSLTSASGTDYTRSFAPTLSPVPEPATWGMMILGFGAVGGILRSRRRSQASALAA